MSSPTRSSHGLHSLLDGLNAEQRLAYVAMTRARDFLYVMWPKRYFTRTSAISDWHTFAQRSRFITDQVAATMYQIQSGKPDQKAEEAVYEHVREGITA